MVHAQKPDFVFRRNGRVHLNRRGRQFSRLLAAEVWASALVMLGTPCSEVMWEYWLPTPFSSLLFTSPPVRHREPSGFKRTLIRCRYHFTSHWSNSCYSSTLQQSTEYLITGVSSTILYTSSGSYFKNK